jgi:hypothetical protein
MDANVTPTPYQKVMCLGCEQVKVYKEFKAHRLVCNKKKRVCHLCSQVFTGKSAPESKRVHLLTQHQKNLRSNEDWWTEFGGIHPKFKILYPTKQHRAVPETGITSPPSTSTGAPIVRSDTETGFVETGITSPPVVAEPDCAPIVRTETCTEITISGVMRVIQMHAGTAIIVMGGQDLREIEFQMGQRTVTVDDVITVALGLNDNNSKPIIIDGELYHIRFGAPSRELVIDDFFYPCIFGASVDIMLADQKMHKFETEGPPPQVVIGKKRLDLVMINNQILPLLDLQQQLADHPNYQTIPITRPSQPPSFR